ncbi:MAG: thrombospondin type 3 repeat-containing protein [Proteobacteria bacterium]|nr:thrombospondin type 3 repeat-containing protein [Pseudomonadota bacterium]
MASILIAVLLSATLASTDGDGDGVLNQSDACPTAVEDRDGFEDGDGCPDPDNDLDGVPDTQDKCPIEAEDLDAHEDGDGCPDPDNDGDGLTDATDPCPDQAGPRGCPADTDAALVPFSKLARAVARTSPEEAQNAFTAAGWAENLVGSSGLRGSGIYAQASRSKWSLVPTALPLMIGTDVALVPCSVELIADGRALGTVTAVIVQVESGWRILGVGENEAQVKALATATASAM